MSAVLRVLTALLVLLSGCAYHAPRRYAACPTMHHSAHSAEQPSRASFALRQLHEAPSSLSATAQVIPAGVLQNWMAQLQDTGTT